MSTWSPSEARERVRAAVACARQQGVEPAADILAVASIARVRTADEDPCTSPAVFTGWSGPAARSLDVTLAHWSLAMCEVRK